MNQQLKKAPLANVIFKVWWHLYSIEDVEKGEYIAGDFYNEVRERFPQRKKIGKGFSTENFFSGFSTLEFSPKNDSNLAILLDNDSVQLVHSGKDYNWADFYHEIKYVTKNTYKVLQDILELDHIHLDLDYTNFIPFDYKKENIVTFLRKNLKLDIQQDFYKSTDSPFKHNFSFTYPYDEGSSIRITIGSGVSKEQSGIIVQINAISGKEPLVLKHMIDWSEKAHNKCDAIFFNMIEKIRHEFE